MDEITAFCTSGSLCNINVVSKGTLSTVAAPKIRAFKGMCGDEAGVPTELPNQGAEEHCLAEYKTVFF